MDIPKILIIDDDPALRKTLSDILRFKGYEPFAARDGVEGLLLIDRDPVNVVLIDLDLPDIPGIEVLARVKSAHPSTEAIILTGHAALDTAIEATNRGAFSYLQKPYEADQLLLHIRRALEKQVTNETIKRRTAELERANEELKASSLHDPLTGLANRRLLQVQMEKLTRLAARYYRGFSAIMMDIDHFKDFNDAFGHAEGDKLLVKVAEVLSMHVRDADYVFRYGGEEFLALLPETGLKEAVSVAERIRESVEARTAVTVSLGVASCHDAPAEEVTKKADEALYRAKRGGRNKVEAYLPGAGEKEEAA